MLDECRNGGPNIGVELAWKSRKFTPLCVNVPKMSMLTGYPDAYAGDRGGGAARSSLAAARAPSSIRSAHQERSADGYGSGPARLWRHATRGHSDSAGGWGDTPHVSGDVLSSFVVPVPVLSSATGASSLEVLVRQRQFPSSDLESSSGTRAVLELNPVCLPFELDPSSQVLVFVGHSFPLRCEFPGLTERTIWVPHGAQFPPGAQVTLGIQLDWVQQRAHHRADQRHDGAWVLRLLRRELEEDPDAWFHGSMEFRRHDVFYRFGIPNDPSEHLGATSLKIPRMCPES
eukprot:gene17235-biopygen1278